MARRRIKQLREWIALHGVDALLISSPENRYYISGFTGDDPVPSDIAAFLIITPLDAFIITDFRYKEQTQQEAPDFHPIIYKNSVAEAIITLLLDLNIRTCAFEDHHISVEMYTALLTAALNKEVSIAFVPSRRFLEKIRAVKEDNEIERIRASLYLTETIMEEVVPLLDRGLSERELAWFIERRMREMGAEGIAFSPIVASGPRSALPHAYPTNRIPKLGEPIVIDIGARLNHYCSDMTRTFFRASIPHKWGKRYHIVREAQEAAQEAIKAGVMTDKVDACARKIIEDAGFGELFGHSLGHGVGLAIHELPRLRKSSPIALQPNMVVTVEPGIYFQGEGGIRLENMVQVTETGCKVLNRKHFLILDA